ncbi:ArnT family glycosyltransferase [Rubinisphaera sp. JC750]|uniref:ArnT family glycosyltransferase n=1 Tax=Rubinisphaera sp. JC750 TaxID=2898658 RepID=UPI001F41668C|nr:glycosyltransferase family 39 protein [Rubinisphaera sp. JC750]
MSRPLPHGLLLALTCGLVFFLNLGSARLFDEDEPKNAECGREMFERGDWLVPTYNYELRTDKPIMLYWLMLSSFHAFGVSEFAARMPSACMATVTVFCVYLLGRRLFDKRVGFWAAIMLATALFYVTIGRISTPDSTLVGFITLAMLTFVYSVPTTAAGWGTPYYPEQRNTKFCVPRSVWQFALLYGIMGLAVLTKGPVGFLLPCAVIGLFLLCQKDCPHAPQDLNWRRPLESSNELVLYLASFWAPSRFFRALAAMRPITLAASVLAVALPWYIAVGFATNGAWLEGFLGDHNVGRFSAPMEGHSGPIFYYAIAILMGFFPWSVFLPISVYLANRYKSLIPRERRSLIFLLCWAGVYFVFFSIARTKLPNYVVPCYPPLALIVAWTLVRWQEGRLEIPHWALQWGSISLMVAGGAIGIAFPIVSWVLLPGYAAVGLVGLIPLACGAWLQMQQKDYRSSRLLPAMAAGAVPLAMVALGWIAPWISQAQESAQLGQLAAEHSHSTTPVATFRYFTTNMPFYAERPIARYHSAEEIQNFFVKHPEGLLCVRDEDLKAIEDILPARTEVIEETPRFLRNGSVLMLRKASLQMAAEPFDASETRLR